MKSVQLLSGDSYIVQDGDQWDEICCDCGLVHTLKIKIDKNKKIKITMKRNERYTNSFRKKKSASLQTDTDEKGWRMVKLYYEDY